MAAQGQLVRGLVDPDASKPCPARMTKERIPPKNEGESVSTEKLAEGIRGFAVDQIKLEKTLAKKL